MSTLTATEILKGGEFLVKNSDKKSIFTPEDFTEDQLLVADLTRDFVRTKILPVLDKLEGLDTQLTKKLLEEAGEIGLLGTAFPEEYGGSMQDFVANTLLTETMSAARSFSLSVGTQTGIGALPLLYFGTPEQKQQYLPDIISGVKKSAYCLTEPNSGSDALAARTKAVLSEDGRHYILNGQKMWITNGGFADVFTIFAKIDGIHFTGFIVERQWEGVSIGAEEKKLGIKGSSTCQVFLENVKVPVENLLGEIGKGHKIAFNILNIGRIKLAAGVVGASKNVATVAINYANERQQFKQSISNFGAIKHKIAEQGIRIFANESAIYRSAHDIHLLEKKLLSEGKNLSEALLGAAEEYAIECALLKVHATECLSFVVDEGLQIYGGMGFSEEAPMASAYRDARINRIFEGTNEINRMLAVDMLLKRAMKGHIDLFAPTMAVQKEIMGMPALPKSEFPDALGRELDLIANLKKAFLLVSGATAQQLMQNLEQEQEILMYISDMMADIYLAESTVLRVQKMIDKNGREASEVYVQIAKVFLEDAIERVALNGKRCLVAWAEGDMKRMLLLGLKRFTNYEPSNLKDARRQIANHLIAENKYSL